MAGKKIQEKAEAARAEEAVEDAAAIVVDGPLIGSDGNPIEITFRSARAQERINLVNALERAQRNLDQLDADTARLNARLA